MTMRQFNESFVQQIFMRMRKRKVWMELNMIGRLELRMHTTNTAYFAHQFYTEFCLRFDRRPYKGNTDNDFDFVRLSKSSSSLQKIEKWPSKVFRLTLSEIIHIESINFYGHFKCYRRHDSMKSNSCHLAVFFFVIQSARHMHSHSDTRAPEIP